MFAWRLKSHIGCPDPSEIGDHQIISGQLQSISKGYLRSSSHGPWCCMDVRSNALLQFTHTVLFVSMFVFILIFEQSGMCGESKSKAMACAAEIDTSDLINPRLRTKRASFFANVLRNQHLQHSVCNTTRILTSTEYHYIYFSRAKYKQSCLLIFARQHPRCQI